MWAGASGQEGVTIVETGDLLCAFDSVLIVIVLPVPDCAGLRLFIRHTPNRHMKTMPATAARLMMSGNFILSIKGVTTVGGALEFADTATSWSEVSWVQTVLNRTY